METIKRHENHKKKAARQLTGWRPCHGMVASQCEGVGCKSEPIAEDRFARARQSAVLL